MGIVVEDATVNKSCQISTQVLQFKAGDKTGQLRGMRADISDGTALAILGRVSAPCGLSVALDFDSSRHPL